MAALTLAGAVAPALAEDTIYVPLFTYRTGPFAGSGIPVADGMHDYLAMLNERDGGIGGVKLAIEECETGYDTKKGIECYEAIKGKKPVIDNPWSTGITLRSSRVRRSTRSRSSPWPTALRRRRRATLPLDLQPARYLLGRPVGDLEAHRRKEGGLDKLKGKKIGYIYLDARYGKEPIPLLEQLAKQYGFERQIYPVAARRCRTSRRNGSTCAATVRTT